LFWHHFAYFVAAGLGTLLRNHAAHFVFAGFLFTYCLADLVANCTSTSFAHGLAAVDYLRLASWHPNTLAASSRWSLASQSLAWARCVNTLALARIPCISTGLPNGLFAHWASNFVRLGFPVTATNLDLPSVGDFYANLVGFFSLASFPNGLAYGVTASLGFPNRLAYGVADFSLASFPNRLAHSVGALLGFPNGLAYGVTASLGFPNGLAYGVANFSLASFPNRLTYSVSTLLGFPDRFAYGVANFFLASFPNGLAHGVAASLGFPNWLANGVANFFLALLTNVTGAVNGFFFAHTVIDCAIASALLTFPCLTSHGFHHSVTLLLTAAITTVVPCSSAVACPCR